MSIVLNLTTLEFFIATDERAQTMYLKKLLTRRPPSSLDWKYYNGAYTIFKSVIEWNRTDKIVIVPPHIESHMLLKNYKYISICSHL